MYFCHKFFHTPYKHVSFILSFYYTNPQLPQKNNWFIARLVCLQKKYVLTLQKTLLLNTSETSPTSNSCRHVTISIYWIISFLANKILQRHNEDKRRSPIDLFAIHQVMAQSYKIHFICNFHSIASIKQMIEKNIL